MLLRTFLRLDFSQEGERGRKRERERKKEREKISREEKPLKKKREGERQRGAHSERGCDRATAGVGFARSSMTMMLESDRGQSCSCLRRDADHPPPWSLGT